MIIWQLAMCPHNYGTFRRRTWQAGGPAKASSRLEAAPGGRPGHLSKSGGKCFSKSGRQQTGALGDKYFQIKCGLLLLLLSIIKMNYFHFSYILHIIIYLSILGVGIFFLPACEKYNLTFNSMPKGGSIKLRCRRF